MHPAPAEHDYELRFTVISLPSTAFSKQTTTLPSPHWLCSCRSPPPVAALAHTVANQIPTSARPDPPWGADGPECKSASLEGCELEPEEQIGALLPLDPYVRYLQEGPGGVYFTAYLQNSCLITKWGMIHCVSHRQLDYHACEGSRGVQMWFMAFEVEHRLITERVIHLRLQVHASGGLLKECEEIAQECLVELGEDEAVHKVLRLRRQCVQYSAKYRRFRN
ncbi:hypothetical protein K438DRAFT_1994384 [Mycena galopus ATCC 62051]|nr:hypothetical protein K438DRAFT_1994384 [Mycena galopus ATCC 62051]